MDQKHEILSVLHSLNSMSDKLKSIGKDYEKLINKLDNHPSSLENDDNNNENEE